MVLSSELFQESCENDEGVLENVYIPVWMNENLQPDWEPVLRVIL